MLKQRTLPYPNSFSLLSIETSLFELHNDAFPSLASIYLRDFSSSDITDWRTFYITYFLFFHHDATMTKQTKPLGYRMETSLFGLQGGTQIGTHLTTRGA